MNKTITVDPETGYISEIWIGFDYGPDVRCVRCKGRGMWQPGRNEDNKHPDLVLCLKCANEWSHANDGENSLLRKHGYIDARNSRGKWLAAYNEFLQIKPLQINLEAHNAKIKAVNEIIHRLFPEYFEDE
jgi:hypothetical protein